jgi:hypothetical protein
MDRKDETTAKVPADVRPYIQKDHAQEPVYRSPFEEGTAPCCMRFDDHVKSR